MIRRTAMLAVFLVSAHATAWAQAGEDFRVTMWEGGTLESSLRLAMLRGGPGSGVFGGVSTLRPIGDPGALFHNPAMLGASGAGILLGARSGLSNASFGLGDDIFLSPSDIREGTDDLLSDVGFTGGESPKYTSLKGVTAGQGRQFGSMLLSHLLAPGVTVAAGYHRPLSAEVGLRMSGGEAVLDAGRRSGSQTIDIDVLAHMSAAANLRLEADEVAAGIGLHLGSDDLGGWYLGASATRTTVSAGIDWSVQPDLMIVLSGSQQYFFNDPADPNLAPGETNRLYWLARARYRGAGWSARGGLRFSTPEGGLSLGITGTWQEPVRMTDINAFAESYLPLFVNLGGSLEAAPHEDELLDVERLNLAKPNLTEQTTDSLGTVLLYRRPNSLTFALDLGLGPHTLTGNYVLYDGEMSAEGTYGSRRGSPKTFRVGKQLNYEARVGLELAFPEELKGAAWFLLPVRLAFLDIDGLIFQALDGAVNYSNPRYRIGGGLVAGPAVVQGVERNVRSDLDRALSGILPSGLAMARRYTVFDRLEVGVTVLGIPDLFFRTSLTYRFTTPDF